MANLEVVRKVSNEISQGCFNARQVLEKYGLTSLGEGRSRVVIPVDEKCVAKIAKGKTGILANKAEVAKYTRSSEDAKRCFAKIYDYDESGSYILMERCSMNFDWSDIPSNVLNATSDAHKGNYGINRKGQPVAVDFAPWGSKDEYSCYKNQ